MLRIITDGEDEHRIESADGTPFGWIRGRAVGFWGFADEAHAVTAATAARRSLDASLRRQFPGWAQRPSRADHVVRRADDAGGPFTIEFELPSYASAGIVIAAAHLMGAVIQHNAETGRPVD